MDGATSAPNPTYIHVTGLSGPLTILGGPRGATRGAVSGFQIVPEPSTFALLGLGGLFAFMRRRR